MLELYGTGVRCALICPNVALTGFQQRADIRKYSRVSRIAGRVTSDQVARQFGDQRNLGLHPLQDHGIDRIHVRGGQRDHRIERRGTRLPERMHSRSHGRRPSPAAAHFLAFAYQTRTRSLQEQVFVNGALASPAASPVFSSATWAGV